MMSISTDPMISRVERRKQYTHAIIKRAAFELLTECGYDALTIQAITDRADVGYGTFYLHFKDKDEIVWAVLQDMGDDFMATVNAQALTLPSPRREYVSWVILFAYAEQNRDGYLKLFGDGGSATLNRKMMDYLAALHIDNIQRGLYTAELDLPVDVLAQFIVGALWRLLIWWLQQPNGRTPEDMAGLLFEMVYHQPPPEG
ncbi:MAG: TetR/AcrR family transcriptional regulator [Chloroflexota bacterium]|nr:TetR/AcrR family transcriptional regulator [Chloroflexota bacterium]